LTLAQHTESTLFLIPSFHSHPVVYERNGNFGTFILLLGTFKMHKKTDKVKLQLSPVKFIIATFLSI